MQIARCKIQYLPATILIVVGALVYVLNSANVATAGYSDSAHGDSSDGVNRSGTGYPIGACTHCHDTFDQSICGVNERMLFNSQFTNQKAGLCMKCHQETASSQEDGVLNNYDYSRVRGGETDKDCPASIRRQFWFIKYDTRLPRIYCDTPNASGSAHDLKNIRDYMKNKWRWGGTDAEVNPCGTCHNPHQATKDYPCSKPSSHSGTWEIWGDDPVGSGEKMADYLGAGEVYQPPYKVGWTPEEPKYERDANTQPDYVTLCLECHQYKLTSYQHTTVGGFLGDGILWDSASTMHGTGTGTHSQGSPKPPYDDEDKNYVLCCTDCHEPHGSSNQWLLRTEVNGKHNITIRWDGDFFEFCMACHDDLGVHDLDAFEAGRSCNDDYCHTHGFGIAPL